MKKALWLCLLLALLLTAAAALADGEPKVSFSSTTGKVNGPLDYTIELKSTAAFAETTDVTLVCNTDKTTYTATFAAGATQAWVTVPTVKVEKRTNYIYDIQAGSGYQVASKSNRFTLQVFPLPHVRFSSSAYIGYVGKSLAVTVSCSNGSSVVSGKHFQLRDQTGRLYAEADWKNTGGKLTFRIDVTSDMEGARFFSVWWNGFRVTEIGTGYAAITDLSRKVIKQVNTEEPYIAITIDCCYYDANTDKILDVLDKYGIKCTFFMTGYYIRTFPESAKKILARGHEIGNHTTNHRKMTQWSNVSQQLSQMHTPVVEMEELMGIRVRLYRPPYGDHNDKLTAMVRSDGMEVIMWTIDSHDWDDEYKNKPDKVIERDKRGVGPGYIILHHLGGYHTAEILDVVIPYYMNELGLQPVTITELMALEGRTVPDLPIEDTLTQIPEGM